MSGNNPAATAAKTICDALEESLHNFNWKDIETFKTENIEQAIQIATPELEKHRGCKQLIVDLITVLSGVGLVAAAIHCAATHGRHFFFQVKTDSMMELDNLSASLKPISPTR